MTFTMQDIEKIKVDSTYIEMIKKLKRIGVLACDYDLTTGVFTYYGDNHLVLTEPSNGLQLTPDTNMLPEAVQAAVEKINNGSINFEDFCHEVALAGVASWETNLELLHIEYKNKDGQVLMRELIPSFAD